MKIKLIHKFHRGYLLFILLRILSIVLSMFLKMFSTSGHAILPMIGCPYAFFQYCCKLYNSLGKSICQMKDLTYES